MYSITLTFESAAEASDLVADILNNHREANHMAKAPRKPARKLTPRQVRDLNVEAGRPLTPNEREKVIRMKARFNDSIKAQDALGCPTCFVDAGMGCFDERRGSYPIGRVHPLRLVAWARGMSVEEMQDEVQRKEVIKVEVNRINDATSCPTCDSRKGQKCVTAGGHALGHYVHKARRRLYGDAF